MWCTFNSSIRLNIFQRIYVWFIFYWSGSCSIQISWTLNIQRYRCLFKSNTDAEIKRNWIDDMCFMFRHLQIGTEEEVRVTSVWLIPWGMGNGNDNPFERTYEFDGDINVVVVAVLCGLSVFQFSVTLNMYLNVAVNQTAAYRCSIFCK